MRYSLALLACLNLAIGAGPAVAASCPIAFCGTPPPGWTPPGPRRPALPDRPGGYCHVAGCAAKKDRSGCAGRIVPERGGR